MADASMVDIPTNVLVAITGVGTAVTGAVGWLFRSKQAELDAERAKNDVLQGKIQSILQAQLEAEPQRRETLAAIARSTESNAALLKDFLQSRRT